MLAGAFVDAGFEGFIDLAKALLAVLERDQGYAGLASRSAYWLAPASVNTHPANQGFGNYMNGGSFLAMTYWEIMARCAAGDAEGAWTRLHRFAEGTRLTGERGFIGNNWVMPDDRIGYGAGDEPYLSDAIAVPAALVQGILGIRHTNEKLEVHPLLPAALRHVTAEVVHLGVRHRVTIAGTEVKIEKLDRDFTPPGELTWRVNAGAPPEAGLYIERTFEAGSAWSATPEIDIRRGAGLALKPGALTGRYTTASCDWGQLVRLTALHTATALNESTITAQIETSNDDFETIAATQPVELRTGEQTSAFQPLSPARQARAVFTLTIGTGALVSPVLSAMQFNAIPQP